MRDLTEDELDLFRNGYCPVCYQKDSGFSEGPSGGVSVNIRCNNCMVKLNVAMIPGIPFGQIIGANRADFRQYQRPRLKPQKKDRKPFADYLFDQPWKGGVIGFLIGAGLMVMWYLALTR